MKAAQEIDEQSNTNIEQSMTGKMKKKSKSPENQSTEDKYPIKQSTGEMTIETKYVSNGKFGIGTFIGEEWIY